MFELVKRWLLALRLIPQRPHEPAGVASTGGDPANGSGHALDSRAAAAKAASLPAPPAPRAAARHCRRLAATGRLNRPGRRLDVAPPEPRPVPVRRAGSAAWKQMPVSAGRRSAHGPVAQQSVRMQAALMKSRRRAEAERALERLKALAAAAAAATGAAPETPSRELSAAA